ncbi:class I SAM-dependent methyltransferase [Streptomyces sp. URMC 123]|uniref:class I SAM-dependent methyltransferase n=1 Tax=Streptomyces sp. URMC 123 TaxID=3423403 RepID=UPI003F1E3A29
MALSESEGSPDEVRVMPVDGAEYARAFELFLAGTDEKELTHDRLTAIVRGLPRRGTFLDVGAADGTTTRHVGRHFEHVIAVEPSAPMRSTLRRNCPDAVILPRPVDEVRLDSPVDLALCSHVLYYLPRPSWAPTVRRVASWLAPGGELLVLLQNPDNDCMRMVRHFTGARYDLAELRRELVSSGELGRVTLETLPVRFHATNLADTMAVAEFLLSVPDLADGAASPPARRELEAYVRRHFTDPEGGFTIAHDHDILRVRRAVTV